MVGYEIGKPGTNFTQALLHGNGHACEGIIRPRGAVRPVVLHFIRAPEEAARDSSGVGCQGAGQVSIPLFDAPPVPVVGEGPAGLSLDGGKNLSVSLPLILLQQFVQIIQ